MDGPPGMLIVGAWDAWCGAAAVVFSCYINRDIIMRGLLSTLPSHSADTVRPTAPQMLLRGRQPGAWDGACILRKKQPPHERYPKLLKKLIQLLPHARRCRTPLETPDKMPEGKEDEAAGAAAAPEVFDGSSPTPEGRLLEAMKKRDLHAVEAILQNPELIFSGSLNINCKAKSGWTPSVVDS